MRSKAAVVEFVPRVKMYVGADVSSVSRCVQLSARSSGLPNCPFNSPQLLLGTVARERYREESDERIQTRRTFESRETVVLIFSHRERRENCGKIFSEP